MTEIIILFAKVFAVTLGALLALAVVLFLVLWLGRVGGKEEEEEPDDGPKPKQYNPDDIRNWTN